MINKYTINPPLVKQVGDEIRIVGKKLEQWRNGFLIRVVDLTAAEKLTDISSVGGEIINELFLEVGMPGQNVSLIDVIESQTGSVTMKFSSGNNIEFASWAACGEIADNIDSIPDLAEKILVGRAYRESMDGANKTTQIGASVSCNLLAASPIVYTGPE